MFEELSNINVSDKVENKNGLKYNINYRTLLYRLNNNYTLEEAIKGVK